MACRNNGSTRKSPRKSKIVMICSKKLILKAKSIWLDATMPNLIQYEQTVYDPY